MPEIWIDDWLIGNDRRCVGKFAGVRSEKGNGRMMNAQEAAVPFEFSHSLYARAWSGVPIASLILIL